VTETFSFQVKFTRGVGDTCRVVEVPRNEKDPNYSAVCTQVATLDSGRGSDEFRDLRTQASSIDSGVLLANQMEMEVLKIIYRIVTLQKRSFYSGFTYNSWII
jgi:hypothetical protein